MGRQANFNRVRDLRPYEPHVQALAGEREMEMIVPANWPLVLCAQYAVRLAVEHGCTSVDVVTKGKNVGARRRRKYGILELLKLSDQMSPGGSFKPHIAKVRRIPKNIATMNALSMKSTIDTSRPSILVPPAFSGVRRERKELPNV